MTEYKHKNALVRMHGTADQTKIKAATERFVKRAVQQKKKKEKEKCT